MSRNRANRAAAFLLATLAACGSVQEPYVENLDDVPKGCRILFEADSRTPDVAPFLASSEVAV